MTEWNASEYDRLSALQATMAEEALSVLKLQGNERILDVGCGKGKTTAEIAARVPQGSVTGVQTCALPIWLGVLSTNVEFASSREWGYNWLSALQSQFWSRKPSACRDRKSVV